MLYNLRASSIAANPTLDRLQGHSFRLGWRMNQNITRKLAQARTYPIYLSSSPAREVWPTLLISITEYVTMAVSEDGDVLEGGVEWWKKGSRPGHAPPGNGGQGERDVTIPECIMLPVTAPRVRGEVLAGVLWREGGRESFHAICFVRSGAGRNPREWIHHAGTRVCGRHSPRPLALARERELDAQHT